MSQEWTSPWSNNTTWVTALAKNKSSVMLTSIGWTGSGVSAPQRQEPDLISLFARPHKLTMTSGKDSGVILEFYLDIPQADNNPQIYLIVKGTLL